MSLRQINCRDTALPSPDFGNINNPDATGFDIIQELAAAVRNRGIVEKTRLSPILLKIRPKKGTITY